MRQKLPIGGFTWVAPIIDEVLSTPDDGDEGFIVEADITYIKELHVKHNCYPLAPETMLN